MSDWLAVADLTEEADLDAGLARAAATGLSHVAVAARIDRPASDLEALADAGVVVWGVRLVEAAHQDLAQLRRAIADAAVLGAACVWLRAGSQREEVFVAGCEALVKEAERRMMRLAVEPWPGSAFPDTGRVLAWLRRAGGIDMIVPEAERHLIAEAGNLLAAVRTGAGLLVRRHSPQTSSSTSSAT